MLSGPRFFFLSGCTSGCCCSSSCSSAAMAVSAVVVFGIGFAATVAPFRSSLLSTAFSSESLDSLVFCSGTEKDATSSSCGCLGSSIESPMDSFASSPCEGGGLLSTIALAPTSAGDGSSSPSAAGGATGATTTANEDPEHVDPLLLLLPPGLPAARFSFTAGVDGVVVRAGSTAPAPATASFHPFSFAMALSSSPASLEPPSVSSGVSFSSSFFIGMASAGGSPASFPARRLTSSSPLPSSLSPCSSLHEIVSFSSRLPSASGSSPSSGTADLSSFDGAFAA
mmetsp:Transcript_10698/g.26391  ORF Transcript_10698/g.26391 Transcript_10698/m.26391 type:complete len:283 (-) Transcript_10698:1954-2802(-)